MGEYKNYFIKGPVQLKRRLMRSQMDMPCLSSQMNGECVELNAREHEETQKWLVDLMLELKGVLSVKNVGHWASEMREERQTY